ncbi:MAG TPA: GntR family transcriptional regulator [Thermoanaerobacterales bacterium]|nr:GntR family transcriptional regulator [Thermoanaerobacterales bacterium]
MDKKYVIVKRYLMEIVENFPPNTKIPSERDLINQMGVSRATIQKAISDLEAEGYLYRIHRKGTFTSEHRLKMLLNQLVGFSQQVKASGGTPKTELVEHVVLFANEYLSSKMRVDIGTCIHFVLRVRYKNDIPVTVDYSYFADFAVSGINLKDFKTSVYKYIESVNGLELSRGELLIDAELPEPEVANFLNLSENNPVIKIEYLTRLTDGRIFEYTISYINPKQHELYVKAFK